MDSYVVVLAGGKGERFWPASRVNFPKQVIKLFSDQTLLRETIERTLPQIPLSRTFIVTGEALASLLKETHPDIPDENYIIEPAGKNTAPAICFAAAQIVAKYGDGIMFVLASDHYISPQKTFQQSLQAAQNVVQTMDRIVLMGIQPTRAETGYGYIEVGEKIAEYDGIRCMDVKSFKEKPSRMKAQEFYLSGDFLWNSGNFIFRAGKILEEAKKFLPELAEGLEEYIEKFGTPEADEILRKVYDEAPSISIDYAIMEKSTDVAVLWGAFQWDDVGSWGALERVLTKDRNNNVTTGSGHFLMQESYETTVYNDTDGLVAVFGVSDLVIVVTKDAVLVMNKTRIPNMRELVEKIKENPDWQKFL
ncbi:mannose-1-phosphate guanylyltransferase [bacterium]|nr:mannose-1-phosphate guanylyltransferase [bacterium]